MPLKKISRKIEGFVRASGAFAKFCDKIFAKLDKEEKGGVPVLKMTLAAPILFQKFQDKLFAKLDLSIGKPTLKQTVRALQMSDKDKDRIITRQEFEDFAMYMGKLAGHNLYISFRIKYGTAILLGIIAMLMLTVVVVVNCAVSIQWAVGLIPTFGVFMPSLLVLIPAMCAGPAIGAGAIFLIRQAIKPETTPATPEPGSDEEEENLPKPKLSQVFQSAVELRKARFQERRAQLQALFCSPRVDPSDVEPLYNEMMRDNSAQILDESLFDEMVGSPVITVSAASGGPSKTLSNHPLSKLVDQVKDSLPSSRSLSEQSLKGLTKKLVDKVKEGSNTAVENLNTAVHGSREQQVIEAVMVAGGAQVESGGIGPFKGPVAKMIQKKMHEASEKPNKA